MAKKLLVVNPDGSFEIRDELTDQMIDRGYDQLEEFDPSDWGALEAMEGASLQLFGRTLLAHRQKFSEVVAQATRGIL